MKAKKRFFTSWLPALAGLVLCGISTASVVAQSAIPAPDATLAQPVATPGVYSNPIFYMLCFVALVLLVFIMQLSKLFSGIAENYARGGGKNISMIATGLLLGAAMLSSQPASAQGGVSQFLHDGFGSTVYNVLALIIAVETVVVLYYTSLIRKFIGREKKEAPYVVKPVHSFWDRFNKSVALEKESAILTDHNYDGIQELDNSLPPWWKYGFYFTIVWALVYLVHYHVLGSGPLMIEELQIAEAKAQVALEEFKKKSANFVDENTVQLLTSEADVAAGKALFTEKTCIVCHGQQGQGGTGPNLTDDYWLHGGRVQDVFKTIKYGVPEKGMLAWGNQIAPGDIAKLASYIKSIYGSNPPNPKPPQGNLFSENGTASADSTAMTLRDTLQVKGTPADSLAGK